MRAGSFAVADAVAHVMQRVRRLLGAASQFFRSAIFFRLLLFAMLIIVACWVYADALESKPVQARSSAPTWPASVPPDVAWDWIQLTSGEWLKGELRSMEQDKIDFDSDKLNALTLDWKDIRAIYTAKPMAVMDRTNTITTGRLRTVEDRLAVEGSGLRLGKDDVVSIAKSTTREADRWFGNISAGFNLRSGNVDQRDMNIDLNLRRRTAKSTVRLNYVGNYSEFDSVENANDHRASVTYDYRLSPHWFVRPLYVEYYRDPFQNIESRITLGPGVGYYIVDDSTLTWTVSSGPAYQRTHFSETPPGKSGSQSTAAAFFATNYDQEVTSSVDVLFSYQLILTDPASGRSAHHAMIALDVDLTKRLDLRVASYWDYLEKPQADENGVVPDSSDFRVVVGLNLDL